MWDSCRQPAAQYNRHGRRHAAAGDQFADDRGKHLCCYSSCSEDRTESGNGAYDSERHQAEKAASHRSHQTGQKLRQAGTFTNTDEQCSKTHEGKDHLQAGLDSFPGGLLKQADHFTDHEHRFQKLAQRRFDGML